MFFSTVLHTDHAIKIVLHVTFTKQSECLVSLKLSAFESVTSGG